MMPENTERKPLHRPGDPAARKKKARFIWVTALAVILIVLVAVILRTMADSKAYTRYYSEGLEYYTAGNYEQALTNLRKAYSADPTDDCAFLMVDCYKSLGNYDKALEILRGMDSSDAKVASLVTEIGALADAAAAGQTVTIGGGSYPVTTTAIVLDGKHLGDSVLTELQSLYSLSTLSIAENDLTTVQPLANFGGLTSLNISGNNISDLSPLASVTTLRTLYIDNNPVTDLTPLYSLTGLSTLSIKGIAISENQLAELAAALPNCAIHSEEASASVSDITLGGHTFKSNVTELSLSNLGLTDISALSACTSLTVLNLSYNSISDITPLMEIPGLKTLNLESNNITDIRTLMGMTTLTSLNLNYNNISSISTLGALTNLTELYLEGNPIGDFSGLKKLKNLTTLNLNSTNLQDTDLTVLYDLKNLRQLDIYENAGLTGGGVDALQNTLPECYISHSDLVYTLNFGGAEVNTDAVSANLSNRGLTDISQLTQLTELTWLSLANNSITDVTAVAYCTKLDTLDLSGNSVSDINPLASLSSLVMLNLSGNPIGDITPLFAMSSLQQLDVSGCSLSEEQLQSIRDALPACAVYS